MQNESRLSKWATFLLIVLTGPLYGGDPFIAGESPSFQCVLDSISHEFAPLKHRYRLTGRCATVSSKGTVSYEAWANPISWEASTEWDEETHEVGEQIKTGDGREGRLEAICPADPVILEGDCTGVKATGNIYQSNGFNYHLSSVLISRTVVPEAYKSTLRQQLQTAFPSPKIGSPIADYFYGQAFRDGSGDFNIPVYVSLPYQADLEVTIQSWMPDQTGQSGSWKERQENIAFTAMQKTEYGDAVAYAGRLSVALAPGKHRVFARAVASDRWSSGASETVVFWVMDEMALSEAVRAQSKHRQFPKLDRSAVKMAAKQDTVGDLTAAAFRAPVKSGAVEYSGESRQPIADISRLVVVPSSMPVAPASKDSMRPAAVAPGLVVDRIAQKEGSSTPGQPVDLRVVFRNAGTTTSDPNSRYSVSCKVQRGGNRCPVAEGVYSMAVAIEPGSRHSVKLTGSMAEAGTYLVTVAVPVGEKGASATSSQLQHIVEVASSMRSITSEAVKRQRE